MKKGWILSVLLMMALSGFAQNSGKPLNHVPQIDLPVLDNAKLIKEELSKRDIARPPGFAKACDVTANCHYKGQWYEESGKAIWRLVVHSKGAESLNFGFDQFYLPPSASFYLIGMNSGGRQGPFTVADNESHDQFWSPIIEDDKVMLEITVDKRQKELVQLNLFKVNHAFVKLGSSLFSGSCNLDVICNAGNGWGRNDDYRDIMRSVVLYSINGTNTCTGALINNAREDCTPYILSANHCEITAANASTVVVYYNYENSVCRQPNSIESGQPGNGVFSLFNSGTEWISASDQFIGSDFNLIKLDDPINPNANAFLAGWNRESNAPDSAIAIHHPNLQEKRISFEDDPLGLTDREQSIENGNGSYLRVVDWDIGTTEPGSSGSPLFDTNKRIIGQLFGGFASCANNESDWYGRLSKSWEGLGSPSSRLKDFLDPDNIGMQYIEGKEASECNYYSMPINYISVACKPVDATWTVSTSTSFTGQVDYMVAENSTGGTIDFSPTTINPGDIVTITISNTAAIASGTHGIRIGISDGTNFTELPLWITVGEGTPNQLAPSLPIENMKYVAPSVTLEWEEAITGSYELQVSTDSNYTSLALDTTNLPLASFNAGNSLLENTQYFWRVRNISFCSSGPWSNLRRFTTGQVTCETISSSKSINISESGANTIFSGIDFFGAGQVASIVVENITGTHTWIEDLTFTLISPTGQEIILLAQECFNEDNFDVGFDDNASGSTIACPYINGVMYIPAMPLSSLAGSNLSGKWQLKIIDNADGDGGALNGWSITVCKTDNSEASLSPEVTELDLCGMVNINVPIIVGTGFHDDVQLTLEDEISGLSTTLSSNVVQPGGSVNLSVSGSIGEDSVLVINASDGIITSRLPITLNLASSPESFELHTPEDFETAVVLSSSLSWRSSENANEYRYEIAEDPEFSNIILTNTINDTTVALDLDQLTTYYWRVAALNDCDEIISGIRSFTTEQKFNFNLIQDTIYTCSSSITYEVILNGGFVGNINSDILDPPSGATLTFENNPGQILDTLRVQISNLSMMASSYSFTLRLFDDQDTIGIPIYLEVQESPSAPVLTSPTNNEGNVDTLPTFEFNSASGASQYVFEMSSDLAFTNIIAQITGLTNADPIQPGLDLNNNTIYYWRVASQNECGLSYSPIFTFMTEPNVAVENVFQAESISIIPNPAKHVFNIEISTNAIVDGKYYVYNINGEVVQTGPLRSSTTTVNIDRLSSGIYMVRIQDAHAFIVKKLIIF
ncbi:MAG: proprotein convertase P-domain-containing protein [Bacteroidia bacterium]|nr:proprotein convertase P-domain-containing protein [Bacteroidia bacterium]